LNAPVTNSQNRRTTMQTQPVNNPTDAESHGLEAPARDLLDTLTALGELLTQLLGVAGRKLAAMRAAEAKTLQQCAAEEHGVLQELFERERQRDAVLARLAQSLHWPDSRRVSLSEVAQRLPEPFSSRLRARIAGLRTVAVALKEKNRLAAAVARNLHQHLRAVFEDLAQANQETVGYGPNGKHEQRNRQAWVDAVG